MLCISHKFVCTLCYLYLCSCFGIPFLIYGYLVLLVTCLMLEDYIFQKNRTNGVVCAFLMALYTTVNSSSASHSELQKHKCEAKASVALVPLVTATAFLATAKAFFGHRQEPTRVMASSNHQPTLFQKQIWTAG